MKKEISKNPLQSKTLWSVLLTVVASLGASYLGLGPEKITAIATLGLGAATLFARFSSDTSNRAAVMAFSQAVEELIEKQKAGQEEDSGEAEEAPQA